MDNGRLRDADGETLSWRRYQRKREKFFDRVFAVLAIMFAAALLSLLF